MTTSIKLIVEHAYNIATGHGVYRDLREQVASALEFLRPHLEGHGIPDDRSLHWTVSELVTRLAAQTINVRGELMTENERLQARVNELETNSRGLCDHEGKLWDIIDPDCSLRTNGLDLQTAALRLRESRDELLVCVNDVEKQIEAGEFQANSHWIDLAAQARSELMDICQALDKDGKRPDKYEPGMALGEYVSPLYRTYSLVCDVVKPHAAAQLLPADMPLNMVVQDILNYAARQEQRADKLQAELDAALTEIAVVTPQLYSYGFHGPTLRQMVEQALDWVKSYKPTVDQLRAQLNTANQNRTALEDALTSIQKAVKCEGVHAPTIAQTVVTRFENQAARITELEGKMRHADAWLDQAAEAFKQVTEVVGLGDHDEPDLGLVVGRVRGLQETQQEQAQHIERLKAVQAELHERFTALATGMQLDPAMPTSNLVAAALLRVGDLHKQVARLKGEEDRANRLNGQLVAANTALQAAQGRVHALTKACLSQAKATRNALNAVVWGQD